MESSSCRRRAALLIEGHVQGVFFRQSTRDVATRLGLGGWVQNLPDGRVSLEAEGGAEAVASLIAWCQHGPPTARVTKVTVDDRPLQGGGAGFSIRR